MFNDFDTPKNTLFFATELDALLTKMVSYNEKYGPNQDLIRMIDVCSQCLIVALDLESDCPFIGDIEFKVTARRALRSSLKELRKLFKQHSSRE